MSCPTCDHTIQHIGQTLDGPTRRDIWWCPRCGTIRVDGYRAFDEKPKLVGLCREFESEPNIHGNAAVDFFLVGELWRRLGINESINKPEDRK